MGTLRNILDRIIGRTTAPGDLETALATLRATQPEGWVIRLQQGLDGKWWCDTFLVDRGVHDSPAEAVHEVLRRLGR